MKIQVMIVAFLALAFGSTGIIESRHGGGHGGGHSGGRGVYSGGHAIHVGGGTRGHSKVYRGRSGHHYGSHGGRYRRGYENRGYHGWGYSRGYWGPYILGAALAGYPIIDYTIEAPYEGCNYDMDGRIVCESDGTWYYVTQDE